MGFSDFTVSLRVHMYVPPAWMSFARIAGRSASPLTSLDGIKPAGRILVTVHQTCGVAGVDLVSLPAFR